MPERILISRKKTVLGLHGAGFVNIVFAAPGTTVIELQPPGLDLTRTQLYWNRAAIAGHHYSQVVCADAEENANTHPSARDIVVDCDALGDFVARLTG